MPAAGAATTRGGAKKPNPRDYTGVQKARAEAQHADELEERATELSVAAQATARRKVTEVVDYTKGGHAAPVQAHQTPITGISDELAAAIEEADEVEVGPKEVTIRVNSPIEDMVYGRNVEPPVFDPETGKVLRNAVDHGLQFYSFEEGTRYKVPVDLAIHLEEKGYLYH